MALNVNDLYGDLLMQLRQAPQQRSRNGMVKAMPTPTLFHVENPAQRVLFNPDRKCNPYLHVMETVWMFAGSNDVNFLLPFSKQMGAYAEPSGEINGAYGHRWRSHFYRDQLTGIIAELQNNPDSRQAVIDMYDPKRDHMSHWKDRPCNTHIYFRVYGGCLDMTVCNRSNDVVWGACGANMVHMTYLQEFIARSLNLPLGRYSVMSNNLHVYDQHWPLLDKATLVYDYYHERTAVTPYPLMYSGESPQDFLSECEAFLTYQTSGSYDSKWLTHVVCPMYDHYMCRLNGDKDTYDIGENAATDWQLAERLWREWNA